MIGAVDLGGSHIRAGVVDTNGDVRVVSSASASLPAAAPRAVVLDTLVTCIQRAGHGPNVKAWVIAAPGPFDYASGVPRIRGLAKLESIYGIDLREELAHRLHVRGDQLVFLNDAHAFGRGEWCAGAVRGEPRIIALTLGTGLGSVFLDEGEAVTDGPCVPEHGYLGLEKLGGALLDDLVSTRGFQRAAGSSDSAKELASRARNGDQAALRAFDTVCEDLSTGLTPWIERFEPSAVVVGGSISQAWDLLGLRLSRRLTPGVTVEQGLLGADAPLVGAASFYA